MSTTTTQESLSYRETRLNEQRLLAEVMPGNKAALFEALARAGITMVIVDFDGYGDQGQIESIEALADNLAVELPSEQIEMTTTSGGTANRSHFALEAAIENLVYEILGANHGGWEINDGSYGEFTFNVKEETITLGYNARYTASEYSECVF